ncbi:MAG: Lysine-N-methylase [Magnetococcales bacterium]|nr:Lysine-N-methylase [Magnetococcales bacterium]HIJ83771.1 YkgJ family cysteine cluster protein [Magnetococcales bacterium]
MYLETITFKYLVDFKCTGSECSDICCKGWSVRLIQEDYQKMADEMSGSPNMQEELLNKIHVSQTEDGQKRYRLKIGENGHCLFLGEDRLCSLQTRFGEKNQPHICVGFPRIVSIIGQRMEISSTLACPETARRCLLDPEAMTIVDFPVGMLSDFVKPNFIVNARNPPPYIGHFDLIRAEMFLLCGLKGFTAATRIFFICYFVNRVGAFLNLSTTDHVAERLDKEIKFINDPDVRQELHSQFLKINLSEKKCMSLIEQLMNATFSCLVNSEFEALFVQAFLGLGAVMTNGRVVAGLDEMIANYHQIKQKWSSEFNHEIDQYIIHYIMNSILSLPYLESQNLLLYVRNILIATDVFKLLLFGLLGKNKEIDNKTHDFRKAYLEDTVVKVVQRFSKSINHNQKILAILQQELDRQKVDTLPQMIFLIQF